METGKEARVYTPEEIVQHALGLRPGIAGTQINGNVTHLCSTIEYGAVLVNGETVRLERVDGKCAYGYIRVSTERQRARKAMTQQDGFSEADQAARLVEFFIRQKNSFVLVSDAGLSGGLSFDDRGLLVKMRKQKAQRYREVFEALLLSNFGKRYSPQELASMREFLDEEVQRIEHGGPMDTILQEFAGEELTSDSTRYRQRANKRPIYRAGLSLLLRRLDTAHTIAVVDMSRLSRSEELIAAIIERLHDKDVSVKGLIEDLSFLNQRGPQGKLLQFLMSWYAEIKLTDVLMGSFRGILAMLESGRPHGKIPSWLYRDDDGFAHLDENNKDIEKPKTPAIRRLVQLYMQQNGTNEFNSFNSVAVQLAAEGYESPENKHWTWRTVADILRNPALAGKQRVFGKLWDVFPALLSEFDYQELQRRLNKHAESKPRYEIARPDGYLAQGLVRCHCGRLLAFHQHHSGVGKYICRIETAQRRKERAEGAKRHITLLADDLHRFLDELMQDRQSDMLSLLDDPDEQARLEETLEQWETELSRAKLERFRAEQNARPKATEQVKAIVDEADPDFRDWVDKAIKKLTRSYQEREDNAAKSVRDIRLALDALRSARDLEGRAKSWSEMTTLERNRLLRSIFQEFQVVGDPPDEALRPVYRNPPSYPVTDIWLNTRQRGDSFIRRLPSAESWLWVSAKKKARHQWTQFKQQMREITPPEVREAGRKVLPDGSVEYQSPPMPLDELERIAPELAALYRADLEAEEGLREAEEALAGSATP